MAKGWNYADMVQEAALAGGPEKWIETIKEAAYNRGVSDTKNKLAIPLLLVGVGLGRVGEVGYQKIRKWLSHKKEEKLLIKMDGLVAEEFPKKESGDANEELKKENQEGED